MSPSRARLGPAKRPRIVLAEPDPYLALLVRLSFPDADVREAASPDDLTRWLRSGVDAVLCDLRGDRIEDALANRGTHRTIAIVDAPVPPRSTVPFEVTATVLRPFVAAELDATLHRVLGRREGVPADEPVRWSRRIRIARVAAMVLGGAIEVGGGTTRTGAAIVIAAMCYALLRLARRPHGRIAVVLDTGVAALLLAVSGGATSPYIGFGLAAAAGAGVANGMLAGTLAGLAIAAGGAAQTVAAIWNGTLQSGQLIAYLAVFPLAGVAGGLLGRIARPVPPHDVALLAEANRVLSSLYRIARDVPGGLDQGSVAAAALDEVRRAMGAPAGLLLVGEADVLACAGAFGLAGGQPPAMRHTDATLRSLLSNGTRIVAPGDLPAPLAAACAGHPCWLATPLRHQGHAGGLLLAACPDHAGHDLHRLCTQRIADQTAVAVENARLFGRVRRLSADEERARLARELHDGVAQSLAHVRMELEFLGGQASGDRAEITRLARVAGRALGEVRSAIEGLRTTVPDGGLPSALAAYLDDLRGLSGPQILFDARGDAVLPAEVEHAAFRIAQEAVSNAVRHSGASRVEVRLDLAPDELRLSVGDDGHGIVHGTGGKGLGLRAMRDRAAAIGAGLRVAQRAGGGTRVELSLDPSATVQRTYEEVPA